MYSASFPRVGIFLLLVLGLSLPKASAQSLLAYISAPDTQTSFAATNPVALTETFNSLPLGNQTSTYNSAIGGFQFPNTSQGAIIAADQFGGANGSQYM